MCCRLFRRLLGQVPSAPEPNPSTSSFPPSLPYEFFAEGMIIVTCRLRDGSLLPGEVAGAASVFLAACFLSSAESEIASRADLKMPRGLLYKFLLTFIVPINQIGFILKKALFSDTLQPF